MLRAQHYYPFLVVAAMSVVVVDSPAQADQSNRTYGALVNTAEKRVDWSGCYAGLHAGYVNSQKKWDGVGSENGPRASGSSNGGLIGLQGGCSYQFGEWLVGVQADQSFTRTSFSTSDVNSAYAGMIDRSSVSSFGSFTGRVGFAVDNVLGYAKAGLAWEKSRFGENYFGDQYAGSRQKLGYLVGAGLEYRFAPSMSVFVEYNYANYGAADLTLTRVGGVQTDTARIRSQAHIVKVGLNWWFLRDVASAGSR